MNKEGTPKKKVENRLMEWNQKAKERLARQAHNVSTEREKQCTFVPRTNSAKSFRHSAVPSQGRASSSLRQNTQPTESNNQTLSRNICFGRGSSFPRRY